MKNAAVEKVAAWRRANPEKYAAQLARARSPERRAAARLRERNRDKEAKRAKDQRYQERNREAINARRRERYRTEPERRAKHKARVRTYREKHRERHRAAGRLDRRRRYLGRDTDAFEYGEVLRRDLCSYCGGVAGAVDHIDSMSQGGPNAWDNLTATCRPCNSSKHSKSLLTFLIERNAPWPSRSRSLLAIATTPTQSRSLGGTSDLLGIEPQESQLVLDLS